MALEERSGKFYYYGKVRSGDRVESVYIGRGDFAESVAKLKFVEQARAALRRIETAADEEIDEKLDEISNFNRNLVDAVYLVNGYHQHRGQWRRKRR